MTRLVLRSFAVALVALGGLPGCPGGSGGSAGGPLPGEPEAARRPIRQVRAPFVGAERCAGCHAREAASWRASFHRTMTQMATVSSVQAPREVPVRGAPGLVLRARGERVLAEYDDPRLPAGSARALRPIALITGSHHMQTYWLEPARGRGLEALPWAFLLDEERFIDRRSLFLSPPERQPAPPVPAEWNRGCIKCHTTDPRPRADGEDPASVDSRVGEMGIACEACHGPGALHVDAAGDPRRRVALEAGDAPDVSITLPSRLPAARASEVCAQCHAVWVLATDEESARYQAHGFAYRPGAELGQSRLLVRDRPPGAIAATPALAAMPDFAERYFWRDGQVRVTGREWNGLVESACARDPRFGCGSCHAMHPRAGDPRPLAEWADDLLRPGGRTGAPCLRCHEARYDSPAHSGHGESSSSGAGGTLCLDCHMPFTTWGLLGASRSHTITVPSVRESLEAGRPNACNLCHLDRTLGWTARILAARRGATAPALDEPNESVAAAMVWGLSGDAGQRALVAWALGWAPARAASGADAGPSAGWTAPLHAILLDDVYDVVRVAAGRALAAFPSGKGIDFDAAAPSREPFARALMERSPRPREARPELLRRPSGGLDRDAVERLLERRDQRPVALWE